MTRSDVDVIKDHFDDKINGLEKRHTKLQDSIESIKESIPQIARSEAESTIAKTSLIKPAEKWGVILSLFMVLMTAFASYGKLTSIMDRFERLERKIEDKRVLENSNWLSENKPTLEKKLNDLDGRLDKLTYDIILIKNGGGNRLLK